MHKHAVLPLPVVEPARAAEARQAAAAVEGGLPCTPRAPVTRT